MTDKPMDQKTLSLIPHEGCFGVPFPSPTPKKKPGSPALRCEALSHQKLMLSTPFYYRNAKARALWCHREEVQVCSCFVNID